MEHGRALSKNQFAVLAALAQDPRASQRAIAAKAGLSVGTVNGARKQLLAEGLLADEADLATVTDAGMQALAPYRVDNAVILAAGLSSRFAPISYEKPKGLLRVRGEVLIERQMEVEH